MPESVNTPDEPFLANSIESPSPLHRQFSSALRTALQPDANGQVLFGAQNEPLRLSQREALTAVPTSVENGETTFNIVQPGGTGKTREGILLADIMHRLEKNSLFVVPSQLAVSDFSAKARKLCPGLDVGTVYANEKRIGRLTFITYASLLLCILGDEAAAEAQEFLQEEGIPEFANMDETRGIVIDPSEYHLVIWDEAHKYLTRSAQKLVARFRHAINAGLSGTPQYYPGKTVTSVFGKTIHEVSLQTAVERKEISDFHNILITTDISTNLDLSSPLQEESEEVARAIDVPARNGIFPDLWRHGKIRVQDREFTLLGEPTIVFGAGIGHVHDLARAFNDSLGEAIKNDEDFRDLLRAKGVDPDAVEEIAAPIHSGGTDDHPGMSLTARNRLLQRYHERKILVLTSTSVLQESFDSPMTSVVIDSVPRQTYVGVGQAGMRALRYSPEKKMAFIINTQDQDHPSLTLVDFQAARGREDGVAVEIVGGGGTRRGKQGSVAPAQYVVTFGGEMMDLAKRRQANGDRLYHEDLSGSSRHFTPSGFALVNRLLGDIAAGNEPAMNTLTETIQPWITRVREYLVSKVPTARHIETQDLDDVLTDTLLHLLQKVRGGALHGWGRFAALYRSTALSRVKSFCRRRTEIPSMQSLNARVANVHASFPHEPIVVALHENLPERFPEQRGSTMDMESLRRGIDAALRTVSERERMVLELRYGLTDEPIPTYEELGNVLYLSKERVRQIEHRAVRLLQHPVRFRGLEDFIPAQRPLLIVMEQERRTQYALNADILRGLQPELLEQKKIINNLLSSQGSCTNIYERTKVPECHVYALSNIHSTDAEHLLDALEGCMPQTDILYTTRIAQLLWGPQRTAYERAIDELNRLMGIFKQHGGKKLPVAKLRGRG